MLGLKLLIIFSMVNHVIIMFEPFFHWNLYHDFSPILFFIYLCWYEALCLIEFKVLLEPLVMIPFDLIDSFIHNLINLFFVMTLTLLFLIGK